MLNLELILIAAMQELRFVYLHAGSRAKCIAIVFVRRHKNNACSVNGAQSCGP